MRALLPLCVCLSLARCACEQPPEDNVLRVEGTLERAATLDDDEAVDVAYASKNARGEWWACDLRLTATACVDDFHVNVYVTLPTVQDFDDLGGAACADDQGNAFGAFELLTERAQDGEDISIPADVGVLLLVATDRDDDGAAALEVDEETKAASVLASGSIEVHKLGSFDDPVSLTIDGETTAGNTVHIEVDAPSTPVTEVPGLDVARTCVPGDAIE
jgi:hypothetical protein